MSEEITHKPKLAISIGDLNGIGPEVIIKTFADKRMLNFCTPVIFANHSVIGYHKKALSGLRFNYNSIHDLSKIKEGFVNVFITWEEKVNMTMGQPNSENASYTYLSLQKALESVREGYTEGLVTAPINKKMLQEAGFNFPGQTEYLADPFPGIDPLMLFLSPLLKVGCLTGHIPLSNVSASITSEKLTSAITTLEKTLVNDFFIEKPNIAVLGLNPHAGEEGTIGEEETEIISPVIEKFQQNNSFIRGPYPADGFFASGFFKHFDAVLAMYHDQGLLPFKALAFEEGVNFTAGLPVVRTSPDHGTGYGIAGKNQADEASFRNAVTEACQIIKNRNAGKEAEKAPLETKRKKEKEGQ